jgi:protein-disulfide isomerase
MSSKKQKEKKIWIGVIVALALILLISYFTTQKNKKEELSRIEKIQVSELQAHLKGNLDSDIKLIEYSDFQCPACQHWYVEVENTLARYGDNFKLEYRHLPLRSIHPNAQIAAQASEAAGMQGKFWEMYSILFERQAEWSQSFKPKQLFKQYAESIGLDGSRFMFDIDSDQVKEFVNKQYDEAIASGLKLSTPTFTVEGEVVSLEDFIKNYLVESDDKVDDKSSEA